MYSKRIVSLAGVVIICISSMGIVNAQKFYIKAVEGYIFSSASTAYNNADPNGLTLIQPSTDISISADGRTTTIRSLYGSIGTGYKIGVAGGYTFTDHLAVELAVNYFKGNTITIGKFNSGLTSQVENCYLRGVELSPTFVIRANNRKFDPYIRAGAIFTLGGSLWIDTYVDQPTAGDGGAALSVRAKSEVKSNFSVGVLGAAGMQFHITKECGVFVEAEFKSFSIGSKNARITEYTTSLDSDGATTMVPGQQLSDLPEYKKSFTFSDEFEQSTNGVVDLTQPHTLPTQKVNLSGVDINIGVTWTL